MEYIFSDGPRWSRRGSQRFAFAYPAAIICLMSNLSKIKPRLTARYDIAKSPFILFVFVLNFNASFTPLYSNFSCLLEILLPALLLVYDFGACTLAVWSIIIKQRLNRIKRINYLSLKSFTFWTNCLRVDLIRTIVNVLLSIKSSQAKFLQDNFTIFLASDTNFALKGYWNELINFH